MDDTADDTADDVALALAASQANRALGAAGQSDLIWGHASILDPHGRGIWIKAAGWTLEEVSPDRVQLVGPAGQVLAGSGSPHIEYPIHTRVYARCPEVRAVVHTHSPSAVAFASLDVPLRALSHDAVPFLVPDVARFRETSDLVRNDVLGDSLAACLERCRGVLIPGHGLVTRGPTAAAAVMYAVLLDRACRIQLSAMRAGGPRLWPGDAEVAGKRAMWTATQLSAGYRALIRRAADLTA